MLDDFTPIVHRLTGRDIKVYGVADVHIGAQECDLQGFEDFLTRKIEADPDAYMVLVGDIVNNGIKDSVTNVYHETMPPSAQIETAVKLLTPVKDKILGAVGGNHERRTSRLVDIDIMHTIMVLLGKGDLYRPNMCFIRVSLERKNVKDGYTMLLMHGSSDGKRQRFEGVIEGVDAVITAHVHRGLMARPSRIVFTTNNTVVVKPHISMVCESWLGYGGYASRSMLLPHETSNPQHLELEFTGSNNAVGKMRMVW